MDPNQIATDQAAVDTAEAQLQADVTKLATDEATHMTTHTPEAEQAVAADITALQADEQTHEAAHAQLVSDQAAMAQEAAVGIASTESNPVVAATTPITESPAVEPVAAAQAGAEAQVTVAADQPAQDTPPRDVHAVVADLEAEVVFWGGEAMAKLRQLIAELRSHL